MNASVHRGSWTDERVERLTVLWNDGISFSAIARAIGGITRNAAIGKAHRLGLVGRAPCVVTPAWRLRKRDKAHVHARKKQVLPKPRPVVPAALPVPEPIRNPTSLMNLTVDQCRYPLWGTEPVPVKLYCGAPVVPNEPWCSACRGIGYQVRRAA